MITSKTLSFFKKFCTSKYLTLPSSNAIYNEPIKIVYPMINFQDKTIMEYPQRYSPKNNQKYLKVHDPKKFIWADYEHLEKLLAKQEEKNQTLIKIPKEVIFIGKSNVGKSSLINSIMDIKLSNVSKSTGTTKALFFHQVRNKAGYIIDSPGYGYADINMKMRKNWIRLLKKYLTKSTRLCRVYFLVNIEHGLKNHDFEYLDLIEESKHNFQVVLTKTDKIKKDYLFDKTLAIGLQLKKYNFASPVIHLASSKTQFGIDFLQKSLIASFKDFYSKAELEDLKKRQHQQQLDTVIAEEVKIPKDLPRPEEMYRLLTKPHLINS